MGGIRGAEQIRTPHDDPRCDRDRPEYDAQPCLVGAGRGNEKVEIAVLQGASIFDWPQSYFPTSKVSDVSRRYRGNDYHSLDSLSPTQLDFFGIRAPT